MPAVQPAARVDHAEVLELLSARIRAARPRVERMISDEDDMYRGNDEQYFYVGASALVSIVNAMSAVGKTTLSTVLDLPSGYGRVLRMLRAAFPDAEITACDINRRAVDFCSRTFGAEPIYSDADPARIPLRRSFDLIWCGSLFTHLDAPRWDPFIDFFAKHLNDEGLLVFSTHGRDVPRRGPADDARWQAIVRDFHAHGFGYRDHAHVRGYGTSLTRPSWVIERFYGRDDLTVVAYVERGWADHHDIVAVVKRPIHHRQGAHTIV